MLVSARNLMKTYIMGDEIVRALDDVSFDIPKGDHISIMGPSGSGKSTLMNIVGGLDTPNSGKLVIAGADVAEMDDAQLAAFRNHTIGFVFQSFNLLPRLTALENVELPMIYAGEAPAARRDRARELLERVGLGARIGHKPTQLSGGQQQRVAIARALGCRPAILMADEPTGALDTATTLDILRLFHELNEEGVTIMVVTHEMDVAESGKRIIEMRDGRIISDRAARHRIPELVQ
jgi:putative ABC transport system ATP-binding protein